MGVNYRYLRGFWYEQPGILVRLETDSQGFVTLNPQTVPAVVDRYFSSRGNGFALDLGMGVVVDHWEFGFGANGVGNRINWTEVELKRYTLESLFEGGDFVERTIPIDSSKMKVELPIEYIGNIGYNRRNWSAVAEVSRGFQGTSFHCGVEWHMGPIEFRGGGRYGLERWHPSGGLGFNLGQTFSIDVAAFGTTTNIERQLRPGLAISLRFNRRQS